MNLRKHFFFVLTLTAIVAAPFLLGAALVYLGTMLYAGITQGFKDSVLGTVWAGLSESWGLWVTSLLLALAGWYASRQHFKCLDAEQRSTAGPPPGPADGPAAPKAPPPARNGIETSPT